MNKVHLVVWNEGSATFTVVAETAKSRGKRSRRRTRRLQVHMACALALGILSPWAAAVDYTSTINGPFVFADGDTVTTSGAPGVTSDGATAAIQSSGALAVTTTGDSAYGLWTFLGGTIGSTGTVTINTAGAASYGVWAGSAGSVASLANVDITTSGSNGVAMFATAGAITSSGTATIKTGGLQGFGVWAFGTGSAVNLTNAGITTTGNSSTGLLAQDGGAITASGLATINTEGDGSASVAADTGANVNLADVRIATTGQGAIGLDAGSGGAITSTGTVTISTAGNGSHGVRATGAGTLVSLADVSVTAGTGLYAESGGSIASTGTATVRDSAVGIQARGAGAAVNLADVNVTTKGVGAAGLYAWGGGSITSSGTTTISAPGEGGFGVFVMDTGSAVQLANVSVTTADFGSVALYATLGGTITSTGTTTINAAGDRATGALLDGASSQIQLNGGTITTTGAQAHGIQVAGGAVKTFDGTAGNVLPTITVSGAGSALLDAGGTGSQLVLGGSTRLSMNNTAGVGTWGAKAENDGLIRLQDTSSTGGTALWADNGTLVLADAADASGSHVQLGGVSALLLDRAAAGVGSLGSALSNADVRFNAPGGVLTIGANNATLNGSLRDGAEYAGRFTNVGQLHKTGATTQKLSGAGNTVGSVDVSGGTLQFMQDGAFTTSGHYTTHSGAMTNVGLANSTLAVGGAFAQASDSTLVVTIGATPDITADSASLGGQLVVNGFVSSPHPIKASEVSSNNIYKVIRTANGITGDFVNNPLTPSGVDYLLHDGHVSLDGKDYDLGFRMAWSQGAQAKGTGSYTVHGGTAFDVDTALADQSMPAGGFASGWDGKSLTKGGDGLLVLSAVNAYTGNTTVEGGTLRTDVANSFASSHAVVLNAGVLDLNGNNQQANRLAGTGGQIQLNGATLTTYNATSADNSAFAGDIVQGNTAGGGLTKTGTGALTLSGQTAWTGDTRLEGGELILDGSAGGARLTSNVIGQGGTTLSLRRGAQLTGMIDPTNVAIDSASTWNMTDSSLIDTMTLAGSINMVPPATVPGRTLTASNWVGQGGKLMIHTVLGDDTSPTDKLVIDGGRASGNTAVVVKHAGGSGAQTNVGIQVVQTQNGGTTDVDAFALDAGSDGYRQGAGTIAAGAYDYRLVRGGKAGNSQDWYLSSEPTPDPTPPGGAPIPPIAEKPTYRPEVGSYLNNKVATSALQFHTLRERQGQQGRSPDGSGDAPAWARIQGQTISRDGAGDLASTDNRYLIHAGSDVVRLGDGKDGSIRLGAMVAYGHSSNKATNGVLTSRGTMDGYSAGVYGTWYGTPDAKSGPYVDTWLMYGSFDNNVSGQGLASEHYRSKNLSASLEAGYSIPLPASGSHRMYIEPQVQVIFSDYSADNHTEHTGTVVSGQSDQAVTTRLGVRLHGDVREDVGQMNPFAELNWWHGPGSQSIAFDGLTVSEDLPSNRLEAKVGLQAHLTKALSLSASMGLEAGTNNYTAANAQVRLNFKW